MGYLTDAIAEIRDHGFTDTVQATIVKDVNKAMWRVCAREPWNFLEATTSPTLTPGTSEVPMPDDFSKLTSFVIPTVGRIRPERRETIVQSNFDALETNGIPRVYYFIGNALHVFPPPDSAYECVVDYISWPAALVPTTSEDPPVPERHRHVITLRALIPMYRRDDDPEQAASLKEEYLEALGDMREDCLRSHYDEPDRILAPSDDDLYY
jgi:hypothetical protein